MTKHLEEYFYKEGCYIEEWLNEGKHPELSIARLRVEPGGKTLLHALNNTTERYVILEGSARVTIGEHEKHITEKDVVVIAPNESQCIQNLEQTDLIFLAICTPRFELKNYVDLSV